MGNKWKRSQCIREEQNKSSVQTGVSRRDKRGYKNYYLVSLLSSQLRKTYGENTISINIVVRNFILEENMTVVVGLSKPNL